jgi:uncharacterized protein (TIGR02680 family)
MNDGLPSPALDRWQPLRCGLLNLYRYDYDEFHFEQGRLLLRGNNGTGKSRVLALQLPFLLDGEISPSRVEPDGDTAKRIEWNLLMGRYPDRTGYTWIEFGRRLPDGTVAFVTLGCGMRAVAGHTGLHGRWLFITKQRIGCDLFLQNSQRQPYGAPRLGELIGAHGQIFTRSEDYRRAVDKALFGLGPRYEPLLELLIRLRRPQLSRKLDEVALSQTLSDALPTVSGSLIEEVAEAFRSLQADRESLRGFDATRAGVDTFLRDYGLYARVAVRRRATAVRSAHAAFEEAQRQARDAERRFTDAETALSGLADARARLESDLAGAEEAVSTLRASPEMRTAEEIEQARKTAEASTHAFASAEIDERTAEAHRARAGEHLARAEERAAETTSTVDAALRATASCALEAELAEPHREYIPLNVVGGEPETTWTRRAEIALGRAIQQRRKGITHLRALESAVVAARHAYTMADTDRVRAADACTAAREAEAVGRRLFEEAGIALFNAYRSWQAKLIELAPRGADEFEETFSAWLERRIGVNPLRLGGEAAHREAIARLSSEIFRIKTQLASSEQICSVLRAEIAGLEQGASPSPIAPATRRADRSSLPGAPLWRLCDFRPNVPVASQAGIEAALEASGLLDAWVLPDGRLVDPDTEDAFLVGLDATTNEGSATHLGQWLAPAIDDTLSAVATVMPAQVERLLQRIGIGSEAGSHWIAENGAWRMGPLSGRWSKSDADYIGESTRSAARRRRLAELRQQLAAQETTQNALAETLSDLLARQVAADHEAQSMPDDQPVQLAGYQLEQASQAVNDTFLAHENAERLAREKRGALDEATRKRDTDADDLHLLTWLGRLDEIERAVSDYVAGLAGLWPTVQLWESVAWQLHLARQHADEARIAAAERSRRRQAASETAAASNSRFEMMREMHGAAIATVLAKLAAAENLVAAHKGTLRTNQGEQLDQTGLRTKAEGDREHAVVERSRNEEIRRAAIASLQRVAEERLLAEAHTELATIESAAWVVTRAVEIARQIEPLLADTAADDESWRRRQDTVHAHVQELHDRLIAHGHQPETHQVEDLVLVRCVFQGRPHTMTELRNALAAEIGERERLLAAREQEIIENHLLGEIAVELQRLIRAAESWISLANRELAARPTSTGLRFRFAWEAEPEGAFAVVRRSFLRTSELWTPAERGDLTRFLQERIRAEQAANEDGSWRDHLSGALDYRRWHRFVVERQQEGAWRRLDKRTYGTGSGGEKALALTLPLFAAAAAHYTSARTDAPRLVMLDEVFAGIDPTMRAQCMGVLAQFELDVVMTSESEWGCYATVPGLAIYHLTAVAGIDAVAATRWLWNGRERRQSDVLQAPDIAPDDGLET